MTQKSELNRITLLALGALGVVYGDIGTSPLYAIKESFNPAHGIPLTVPNIFGILSLVFWALTLVVTVKYLYFVLNADNRGEGGMMALMALLIPAFQKMGGTRTKVILGLGLVGTGLLLGEGVITPAISVLSALEGLEVATPAFKPVIVPLTVMILVALFLIQKKGTGSIGSVFGSTMLLWFLSIAAAGLPWIIRYPEILHALNPLWALSFLATNKTLSFIALGSVVLCITGAEALYADLGHFGKTPIRISWYFIVCPALILNYLGQGAYVLAKGQDALQHPFYGIVPSFLLYPMVALATAATVIASQALISGAFSLTQQAVQLGYLPRTTILHTSRTTEGQIYIPKINFFLMISCIALVLYFGSSSRLAAAYGIAVTGTMTITSILFFNVSTKLWKWSIYAVVPLVASFLVVDLTFFSANTLKIFHGGWIPLAIASLVFITMATWKKGREHLQKTLGANAIPLEKFIKDVAEKKPFRTPGTAVFMSLMQDVAPYVLLQHYKHTKAIHQKTILVTVVTRHVPDISSSERVRVTEYPEGFVKVIAEYGYMERPDLNEVFLIAEGAGLRLDRKELSFYLGRETMVSTGDCKMAMWRKRLFKFLSRNARSPAEFFNLPPDSVIEIGSVVKI